MFDYSGSRYVSFSGSVSETRVNVYDYGQSAYITGRIGSLYHHGDAAFIQLKVNGQKFSGYDYKTTSFFSGTVRGKSVSFFDYEDSKYHDFTVS